MCLCPDGKGVWDNAISSTNTLDPIHSAHQEILYLYRKGVTQVDIASTFIAHSQRHRDRFFATRAHLDFCETLASEFLTIEHDVCSTRKCMHISMLFRQHVRVLIRFPFTCYDRIGHYAITIHTRTVNHNSALSVAAEKMRLPHTHTHTLTGACASPQMTCPQCNPHQPPQRTTSSSVFRVHKPIGQTHANRRHTPTASVQLNESSCTALRHTVHPAEQFVPHKHRSRQ